MAGGERLLQDLSLLLELTLVTSSDGTLDGFAEHLLRRAVQRTCAASGLLFVREDVARLEADTPHRLRVYPTRRVEFLVRSPSVEAKEPVGPARLIPGGLSLGAVAGFAHSTPPIECLSLPLPGVGVLELYAMSGDVFTPETGAVLSSLGGHLAEVIRGYAAQDRLRAEVETLAAADTLLDDLAGLAGGLGWHADRHGHVRRTEPPPVFLAGLELPPGADSPAALRGAFIHPEDRATAEQQIAEGLHRRAPEMTLGYRSRAGRALEERLLARYDRGGAATRLVGLVKEAPRRRPVTAELISAVSHEARAPLFPIIALSDLLVRTPEAVREDWREQVSRILEAGQDLLGLIQQLVDLARIEHELLLPSVGLTSIAEIQGLFLRGAVTIEGRTAPGVAFYADKSGLQRLAECVLSHAGPGGAELALELDAGQLRLELTVPRADGAAPSERVFELFRDRSTSEKRPSSSGVTLPLARALCRSSGGDAHAVDDGPRRRLTFAIPAAPPVAPRLAGRTVAVVAETVAAGFPTALRLAAAGADAPVLRFDGLAEALARHPADLVLTLSVVPPGLPVRAVRAEGEPVAVAAAALG